MINNRIEEDDSEEDYAPSGCVSFMTIHQSKGMEFPVVICLTEDAAFDSHKGLAVVEENFHQPSYEPLIRIDNFDLFRKYYVAFSRAQSLLVVSGAGISNSRYAFALSGIEEYSEDMDFSEFDFKLLKEVELMKTFSFTSHIAKYDECPREYMYLKEYDFSPVKGGSFIFGTLVHQTIEDVHRAVLRDEVELVTDDNIEKWFNANHASLVKQQHAHSLSAAVKAEAINQVKRYVKRHDGDWSQIKEAEVDVSMVKEDYIITGTIDLIEGVGNTYELVDFKSEKNPTLAANKKPGNEAREERFLERYMKQMRIYANLVEERTGKKVSAMNLYYTAEPTDNYIIRIPYNKKEIKETMKSFDATAQNIIAKNYDISNCDPKNCSDCSFRFYCRRG